MYIYIYQSAGDEHGQLLEKVRHSLIEVLEERVEPVEKKHKLMEEERTDKLAEDLMEDERTDKLAEEGTDKVPHHMDLEAAREILRRQIAEHNSQRTEEAPKDFMEDERTDKVPPYMAATWRLQGAIPYLDFMECFNTKPSVVLYKARPLNKSQRAHVKHEKEPVKQEDGPVKHEHEPVKQEKVPVKHEHEPVKQEDVPVKHE